MGDRVKNRKVSILSSRDIMKTKFHLVRFFDQPFSCIENSPSNALSTKRFSFRWLKDVTVGQDGSSLLDQSMFFLARADFNLDLGMIHYITLD